MHTIRAMISELAHPTGNPVDTTPIRQYRTRGGIWGLGILVGDGMLPSAGRQKILETYYSFPVLA